MGPPFGHTEFMLSYQAVNSVGTVSSLVYLQCVCGCVVGCVRVHFAVSDANWGSTGGREGHLRAAVVVEFAHAGAAYHSTVGVRSSVCMPVPETPDVALWADR